MEQKKPPIISARAVERWVGEKQGSLDKYTKLTISRAEVKEAQRDADVAYYEPLIKTLKGEPLELSDDWENNLYRNIVHTLVETEGMIPGGQAERVMKVCKALYEPLIQQARQQTAREIFEEIEHKFLLIERPFVERPRSCYELPKEYQSLKSKYLPEKEGGKNGINV